MTDTKELPKGDIVFFDGRGDAIDGYSAAKVWEIVGALQAENERLTKLHIEVVNEWRRSDKERASVQAKLDELQRQEPIGEVVQGLGPRLYRIEDRTKWGMKLYAAPKALEPLTEKKADAIALDIMGFAVLDKEQAETARMLIRATEAAHGIEGTP